MLTIACPKPDGMLPIALLGSHDQLKQLIVPLGFEFLPQHRDSVTKLEV